MTDDKMAAELDRASEAVRAAMHARSMPEFPSDLYARVGSVAEIIDRLRQVVTVLGDQVGAVESGTADLASDDTRSASEHAEAARARLTETYEDLCAASVAANNAFSSLSHLKIDG